MTSWNSLKSKIRSKKPIPPTFHILIATSGRPCLQNMLNSLQSELSDNDAITIVFDGEGSISRSGFSNEWLKGHISQITVIEQPTLLGYWGHGIRNKYQGVLLPKTTFIMNADDDDVYVSGSFDILRNSCVNPHILHIACLYHSKKHVRIPSLIERKIMKDDISTQCGIIPFDKASLSEWKLWYGGDFDYYHHLQHHVSSILFLNTVIYTIQSSA